MGRISGVRSLHEEVKLSLVASAPENYELSLRDLILGFMEYASGKGKNFPPFESRLWDDFLHILYKNHHEESWPFLEGIPPFEWEDGPYPTVKNLSFAMFALRHDCHSKTAGGRVELNYKARDQRNSIAHTYPILMESAFQTAIAIPGFFEK